VRRRIRAAFDRFKSEHHVVVFFMRVKVRPALGQPRLLIGTSVQVCILGVFIGQRRNVVHVSHFLVFFGAVAQDMPQSGAIGGDARRIFSKWVNYFRVRLHIHIC
jgi:hypothetical protein